jgi:MFS family permease
MQPRTRNLTLWLIGVALLFPLFIQLSGGIYNSARYVIDSGGVLSTLPLPISIAACVFGILALARDRRQAVPAAVFIAVLAAAMLLSMVFAGENLDIEKRKALLAAQFLLPTMGLVLGQLVRDEEDVIPRAFMWVLILLVPVQLAVGWWQKTLTLTHYFYFFSIYQHFQFVPVIFIAAYCVAVAYLWERHKTLLRCLSVVMGVYAVASASFLAIGLYGGFVVLFFSRKMLGLKTARVASFVAFGLGIVAAVLAIGMYYGLAKTNTSVADDNGQYVGKFDTLVEGKLPVNVRDRLGDWALFRNGITENTRTLVFGHVEPLARAVKTSAHNWYLDFTYSFGLVSLLPMLALIVFTAYLVWRRRKSIAGQTWWLAAMVAFLVLVDSNFKVTLRQPYPGIFAYFLWGLLLSRLRPAPADRPGA